MPRQPWWANLESNFSRRPEGFELDVSDQMRVSFTALLDVVLRTAGATAIGATAVPIGFHPLKLWPMLKDADFYKELANQVNVDSFFVTPPSGIRVDSKKTRIWNTSFRPKNGTCVDLSFESPFVPVNPRHRKAHLKHKKNRTAHARYWRHSKGPRPIIAAIHGYFADQYWLNEWLFALKWFYRMGCDILLFSLPFHGRRQMRFSPFSGYGFFANGLAGINESLAQAVYDFRIFMNYLRDERGVDKIGLTGVSLGGFTTALVASVEKRLSFAIPNVPVTSIADLILEWEPIGTILRSMMLATGRSVKELRHMLAVSTPLTYEPKLPRERLMIIGGVGDRLAPPKHSRLLWDHWGRCPIHWFPGSHVVHLDRGAYLKEMAKFITGLGFLDQFPFG